MANWDSGLYQVGLHNSKGMPISLRSEARALVTEAGLDPNSLQAVHVGVWLVQINTGDRLLTLLDEEGQAGFKGEAGTLDIETP